MIQLGATKGRAIFYLSTQAHPQWWHLLPTEGWLAFTIADEDHKALLSEGTCHILDKGVRYTCSAGELAGLTEQYFDEEIVWRAVQQEEKTGKPYNYEDAPVTTLHRNFSEGFWFAAVVAADPYVAIDCVVCIDFTTRRVKRHLNYLLEQINKGWLPSDEDMEPPEYDH